MKKMRILALSVIASACFLTGGQGLFAQRDISILGGTGGGVHGFIGFEHELLRLGAGELFLRESVGGSYVGGNAVVTPELLAGYQILDLEFLRLDANLALGAHLVAANPFSFLPYASAGAELSSYFLFAGYSFSVAVPDLSAPDPHFLHQVRAGVRFKLGPRARRPAPARKSGEAKPNMEKPKSGKPAIQPAKKPAPKKPAKTTEAKDGAGAIPAATILAPKLKDGVFTTTEASITVSGQVSAAGSVKEVLVKGVKATLGEKGAFSAAVKLTVGENKIVVTVVDKKGKKTEKAFTVVRRKK